MRTAIELTQTGNVLRLLKPQMKFLDESAFIEESAYKCELCKDSGRVYFTEEAFGREYEQSKKCVCLLEKIRVQKLSVIPPKFADIRLADIRPNTDFHKKQAEYVPAIQENPHGSYFLAGSFGTGKTMLMWALYREAVESNRRTVICTLTELLTEYKRFIQSSMDGSEKIYPRIGAEDLRQTHTKFSIFLDDIDKAKPTEYAAEQVFELADAIYAYGHQIVVTTNLRLTDLVKHFDRADERFGGGIVRRLVDNSMICEMF